MEIYIHSLILWLDGGRGWVKMFPSGIEPETFSVLGRCDNHYTTETSTSMQIKFLLEQADDQEVSFFYFCLICVYDCLYGTKNKKTRMVEGGGFESNLTLSSQLVGVAAPRVSLIVPAETLHIL